MTSKERVRAAISHKEPDVVPASMNCVAEQWEQLMKHYSKASPDEVMDHFEIDIRAVDAPYIGPEMRKMVNAAGETETEHPLGFYQKAVWNGKEFNGIVTYHPLDDCETVEEALAPEKWPNPDNYDYEAVKLQCERHKDRALIVGWEGPFQVITFLRSEEKFYMDMALDLDYTKAILDRFNEYQMEHYERILMAADGQIDILKTHDDYGTQRGLLFSVDMWQDYFAENTKKLCDLAHKYGAYFMQHSCGAVSELIPHLIGCGIDILDPIQKLPGLEPDRLKAAYGDRLTFHGGIDTQYILPLGTPQEVAQETEIFIETLNRSGGYILSASQDLEGDVPAENVAALYETRRKMMQ